MKKHFAYAALALICFMCSSPAQAQQPTANKIAAESLFDSGLKLMQQGKYAEACARLEQSQAADSGIGTMLYLAECYERLGRTASAWALFREASSAARAEGQMERSLSGAQRANALEGSLSQLTIQLAASASVDGLQVLRDGLEVPSGLWNVPVPVDPGEHTIEARAPGKLPFTQTASVAARATVVVDVPALQDAPPDASALMTSVPLVANPGTPVPPPPSAQEPTQTRTHSRSLQPIAGIVVGAVGVVAFGIGGYFGADAISKKGDADDRCGAGASCSDARGVELNEDAQDSAQASNVLMIGGAVLVAAGIVLYVTAPSSESPSVALQADAASARVSLRGMF